MGFGHMIDIHKTIYNIMYPCYQKKNIMYLMNYIDLLKFHILLYIKKNRYWIYKIFILLTKNIMIMDV